MTDSDSDSESDSDSDSDSGADAATLRSAMTEVPEGLLARRWAILRRCSGASHRRGQGSRGRNRGARFHTALGSMRETLACVEVGHALGYIGDNPALVHKIDRICGALYSLAR